MRILTWDEVKALCDTYIKSDNYKLFCNSGKTYTLIDVETYTDEKVCVVVSDGTMYNYYTIFKEDYNDIEVIIDIQR